MHLVRTCGAMSYLRDVFVFQLVKEYVQHNYTTYAPHYNRATAFVYLFH